MPPSSTDTPVAARPIDLRAHASDVTSQHGENGIIAAVFQAIGTTNKVCVEFGAYDLRKDSCVYPFWAHEGWQAVLFEANTERAAAIRRDYEARRPDERTGSVLLEEGFVRPEGPDSLDARLGRLGIPAEPDLVVIDVDGLDYQIFRAMERTRPRVLLCEFNPTVPPHVHMVGRDDGNYVGCSALALHELGNRKGYRLVACTLVNAVFVRADLEPERHFAHVDDLRALFDPRGLCWLMSGYDGGVFLTREPFFKDWLFADSPKRGLPDGHPFVLPSELANLGYFASRAAFTVLRRRAPRTAKLLRKMARALPL